MQDAQPPIRAVQEFLEGIDWELIGEASDLGSAALRFLQRHPWVLVAGGVALSAIGAWQMVAGPGKEPHGRKASARYSETDLMAP